MKGEKHMAESKKNVAASKAAKTEPAAVPVETKVEVPEKKEEVKAAKKETKTAAKKAPAKKAAAKKTTTKKAVAEKAEPKTRGRKAAAPVVKQEIHFQFSGKSYSTEELQKIAADVWKYDLHKEGENYTSLELYVKPEENTVYYVFNGDITGSFFI